MWCRVVGAIVMLTLHLLTAPLGAEAQPAGKMPRIGFIGNADPKSQTLSLEAFRQGLDDFGKDGSRDEDPVRGAVHPLP